MDDVSEMDLHEVVIFELFFAIAPNITAKLQFIREKFEHVSFSAGISFIRFYIGLEFCCYCHLQFTL